MDSRFDVPVRIQYAVALNRYGSLGVVSSSGRAGSSHLTQNRAYSPPSAHQPRFEYEKSPRPGSRCLFSTQLVPKLASQRAVFQLAKTADFEMAIDPAQWSPMGTRSEFGINMRWLWLGVGLIVAAPVWAVVAYGIWLSSIDVVCTYLDARFVAGPALALLLAGAGIAIGLAGLRSRVSAPAIVLVVLGIVECTGFGFEVLQIAGCIPAAP